MPLLNQLAAGLAAEAWAAGHAADVGDEPDPQRGASASSAQPRLRGPAAQRALRRLRADLEMTWFRRYNADKVLQALLLHRQHAGELNVIDEGQAWHVCVRPGVGRALRLIPQQPAADRPCAASRSSLGPGRTPAFRQMLASLAPRGEPEETLKTGRCWRARNGCGSSTGTSRAALAVSGWPLAAVLQRRDLQPPAAAGRLRACGPAAHDSDTEVVLEAFLQWGEPRSAGSAASSRSPSPTACAGRIYLARDPVGVKPLYWSGATAGARRVRGQGAGPGSTRRSPRCRRAHGWAAGSGRSADPVLKPYVDLLRLGEGQPAFDDEAEAAKLLRAVLADSIRLRVDTDLTVGVILSGGLDSSLVLHVREMHPDCVALTIGAPGSADLHYARRLTRDLGVPHEVIDVRPATSGWPTSARRSGCPS